MSGTTMPIDGRPDLEVGLEGWGDPIDRAEDPLLESIYEDLAAMNRGLAEIRRLAEHLDAQLGPSRDAPWATR
jgi:hypothetical protein